MTDPREVHANHFSLYVSKIEGNTQLQNGWSFWSKLERRFGPSVASCVFWNRIDLVAVNFHHLISQENDASLPCVRSSQPAATMVLPKLLCSMSQ